MPLLLRTLRRGPAGEVFRVVCPEPSCGMPLPPEAAEALLPPAQRARYRQLLALSFVAANPSLRWWVGPVAFLLQ